MALEDITAGHTIADLNVANPAGGDDRAEGDDHIRNLKKAVQQTFMNISATVSSVAAELDFAHKGGTVSGNAMIKGTLTLSGAAVFQSGLTMQAGIDVSATSSFQTKLWCNALEVSATITGHVTTAAYALTSLHAASANFANSASFAYTAQHAASADYALSTGHVVSASEVNGLKLVGTNIGPTGVLLNTQPSGWASSATNSATGQFTITLASAGTYQWSFAHVGSAVTIPVTVSIRESASTYVRYTAYNNSGTPTSVTLQVIGIQG